MHLKSTPRDSYLYVLLLALGMGGAGAGCGGEDPLSEKLGSVDTRALAVDEGGFRRSAAFGIVGGTKDSWNTIGNMTPVTFINGYATSTQVYGIELKWGTAAAQLYGITNGLDPKPLDCTDDPIMQIKACVDSNGVLTGLLFKTVSNAAPSPLLLGQMCGSANQVAYSDIDDVLTNMQTWRSPVNSALWGVKFAFTGPL